MAYTQVVEVTAEDERALEDHVAGWHHEQLGIAPGYAGARILADRDRPGRYLIEVDFTSEEEGAANNDRAETNAWAAKLRELVTAEPQYGNYRVVCSSWGAER